MEVNDRPIQSGSDDENTTKALKAEVLHSRRLFTGIWFIFHSKMSLNSGGTFAHCLCLFFNELEFCVKTTRSSRIIRMSHIKRHFFKALPRILSLCKLGNDQSYEFKGLED